MKETIFRSYLAARGLPLALINPQIEFIQRLESGLQQKVPTWTLEDLNGGSAQAIVDDLIDQGENSPENLQAIAHYARAINNSPLYTAIFCMLDGHEAMDQLFDRLGAYAGEDLRDIIFEDLPLPPLGLSRREKARYTYRIINRMEMIFEKSTTREILKDGLHLLPEGSYADEQRLFDEDCQGDIDQFLLIKGQRFIQRLEGHRDSGELFFGQEINDDVIAFVRSNPQIGQGERVDKIIIETKIPYNTAAYLSETDPVKKRYHSCHCPWVRESLLKKDFTVSETFCECSAGFHKKRYEVIFGIPLRAEVLQSALAGDDVCQFAIYLPEDQIR